MSNSITVGDRVICTRDLDFQPYATIGRGERGTVVRKDADGNIDILLDKKHPGLSLFENCIWMTRDSSTDEVRDALLVIDADTCECKECRACKIRFLSACSPQVLHSTASATL